MTPRLRNDLKAIEALENGSLIVTEDGTVFRIRPGKTIRLIPDWTNNGYGRVHFHEKGKLVRFRIHRLVAIKYLGHQDREVDHIDGDKRNNHYSNLRYVDRSSNCLGGGAKQTRQKMTQKDFDVLRERLANGESMNALAQELGMSWGGLQTLLKGHNPQDRFHLGDLRLKKFCEQNGVCYSTAGNRGWRWGISRKAAIVSILLGIRSKRELERRADLAIKKIQKDSSQVNNHAA